MIGIRREDKNRWERRAPLTPDHVAALARTHGIRFRVEPSSLRVFPDREYAAVGVAIPVLREIYEPVLDELEELGIAFEERTEVLG